jgi:hypothetical protein
MATLKSGANIKSMRDVIYRGFLGVICLPFVKVDLFPSLSFESPRSELRFRGPDRSADVEARAIE